MSPSDENSPARGLAPLAGRDVSLDATLTPATYLAATAMDASRSASPGPSARALLSQSLRLPTLTVTPRDEAEGDPRSTDAPAPAHDFALGSLLGEGGMGQVRLATQRALRRDVAVKMLRAGEETPAKVDALLGEALTMGRLEHPNIIPVHMVGQTEARAPLFVMRRVSGVNWRALLQEPGHEFFAARGVARDRLEFHLDVFLRLCDAVDYAHSCGVIHRDIKPENVMLGEFGEVYLVDWGIALNTSLETVAPGVVVGTPMYMAPEMTTGDPAQVDARTDVYLLGASLLEVVTGAPPHRGDSLLEVLAAASLAEPPTLPATVPTELAEIVLRATAAAKADRFASAGALRSAIVEFRGHRGSLEISAAARERLADLRALASESPDDEPTAARRDAVQTCFTECQFGFLLALREWPQNADARAGLLACLELMVRVALARRDIEAARRLLSQLDDPSESLRAELDALAAARAREQDEVAQMHALRRDLDIKRGASTRARLFTAVFLFGVLMTIGIWLLRGDDEDPSRDAVSTLQGIKIALIIVSVYVVAVWRGRARLFNTLINRRLSLVLGAALVTMLVNRVLHHLLGSSPLLMLTSDLVAMSGVIAIGAVTVHRLFASVSAAFFVPAVLMAIWPRWYFEIFNIAAVVGSGMAVLAFRSLGDERDPGDEEQP